MPIGSIESVVYGTDDIDAAVAFYDDFGLTLQSRAIPRPSTGSTKARGSIIRLADDPSLPAPHYDGNGVRETIYGISSGEELDALADFARR